MGVRATFLLLAILVSGTFGYLLGSLFGWSGIFLAIPVGFCVGFGASEIANAILEKRNKNV